MISLIELEKKFKNLPEKEIDFKIGNDFIIELKSERIINKKEIDLISNLMTKSAIYEDRDFVTPADFFVSYLVTDKNNLDSIFRKMFFYEINLYIEELNLFLYEHKNNPQEIGDYKNKVLKWIDQEIKRSNNSDNFLNNKYYLHSLFQNEINIYIKSEIKIINGKLNVLKTKFKNI